MLDHRPNLSGMPKGDPVSDEKKKSFRLKTYLKIVAKWCQIKKLSSLRSLSGKSKPDHLSESTKRFEGIEVVDHEGHDVDTEEVTGMDGVHGFRSYTCGSVLRDDIPKSPKVRLFKYKSMPHYSTNTTHPPLSRAGSHRTPSPSPSFMNRSTSNNGFGPTLQRGRSCRAPGTTPIMFSNSTGMMKPPAIQKNLECTLEELCYGCKKKIKVTREVLTNKGEIIQEEELLTIKVKPGWKTGTKITFEGMGNQRPGSCPADITFVIAEKKHHSYRRDGDDLEMTVEIPLVKALAGCEISIPLLSGEKKTMRIDDIIYPGYKKVIRGLGMPNTKQQGKRGDLKVVFLIQFPRDLTEKQRSDIVNILAEP